MVRAASAKDPHAVPSYMKTAKDGGPSPTFVLQAYREEQAGVRSGNGSL